MTAKPLFSSSNRDGTSPETGYSFKEWQVVSGGVTITDNSFKIGNAKVEIKAIFTKDPVNYNTVSVTGGEHIISGGKNAVITVKGIPDDSRTYSSFTGAAMDGQLIPTGNYTAEEGSLILTLKASYLDTLSVGKHKLTINFTDGSADTTITVLAKPVPKTGDNSNPVLWIALMILGMAVLAGTAVKVYRKRQ